MVVSILLVIEARLKEMEWLSSNSGAAECNGQDTDESSVLQLESIPELMCLAGVMQFS